MSADARTLGALRASVAVWAFMGLIGVPVLVALDPLHGWRWQPYNPVYDQMVVAIYVALGGCALAAVRRPEAHQLFLWFALASSFTHGAVMLYHAATQPVHAGHLLGDVGILAGGASLALPQVRLRRAARPRPDAPRSPGSNPAA